MQDETTPAGGAPSAARGRRQLVVCCDGTNNTLTGGVADTNVLMFYGHVARQPAPAGAERLMFYDPGVGTPDSAPPTGLVDWAKRSWERAAGLAEGSGVYDNISDCYRFLMRHWRDGDEIYCFGFSRGSFTARCVVGLVNLFGILEPQHEPLLPTLIRIYFSSSTENETRWRRFTRRAHARVSRPAKAASEPGGHSVDDDRERLALEVRRLFATPAGRRAWVHWVGVWDTVESVGMPGPWSRSNPSTATVRDKRVRNVRHALALDEHRFSFVPRLYEEPGDLPEAAGGGPDGRTLKQRWFPGVHCDVGGSYALGESALSNAALRWMVDEVAPALGIAPLPPADPAERAIRHDPLHDTPAWALAGMWVRDMRPETAGGDAIAVIPAESAPARPGTVWSRRRAVWPLALASAIGAACFMAMGLCMFADLRWTDAFARPGLVARGAVELGWGQLSSRPPWATDGASSLLGGAQVGWAMFWDLLFVGAWGYWLGRISSRAFTWMAGGRRPGDPMPRWRPLGMAPLLAVGGGVAADALTWLAMAAHWVNVDAIANALLSAATLACGCKLAALGACMVFVAVRALIAFAGFGRVGAVGVE
ncbi:MAG: DUF2235 domain-containing protein [Burkholderiaceae bacterium]